jgi:hypothetical protein
MCRVCIVWDEGVRYNYAGGAELLPVLEPPETYTSAAVCLRETRNWPCNCLGPKRLFVLHISNWQTFVFVAIA